jgi:hypothetical protein
MGPPQRFADAVGLALCLLVLGPGGNALFEAVRLAVGNAPDILKPLRNVVRGELTSATRLNR